MRRSGTPRQERHHRGGAVQCLDLGLLVDAQHDSRLRRVQVEGDDVSDLVDELRVGRQLEAVDLVGLDAERMLFDVPPGGTEDLDESMIGGAIVKQAAGKVKDVVTRGDDEATDRRTASASRRWVRRSQPLHRREELGRRPSKLRPRSEVHSTGSRKGPGDLWRRFKPKNRSTSLWR